jgi:transketolase
MNVFYVTSTELFDLLNEKEKEKIYPEKLAMEAMGMTDFTLPTMYYWVKSRQGIKRTLYSFKNGHYLGSGKAVDVLREAGLDVKSQLNAVLEYSKYIETRIRDSGVRIR